jgi:hypothetical protein
MLNSISLRGWIRMHAAALLAAGMVMTAAAPPLAAQQEVVDTRLVIMNVRETEEDLTLNEEETVRLLEAARSGACNLLRAFGDAAPETSMSVVPLSLAESCYPERRITRLAPRREVTDYTIFIRENRMAVHAAGLPTMVWRVIPGSHAEMYFYDPETGEIQSFGGRDFENHFGGPLEIINLQAADRMDAEHNPAQYQFISSYEGPDGERLGYPVHRHLFVDGVTAGGLASLGIPSGALILSVGHILIAPDTPYNGVVGRFFENFAAHVDSGSGGMLGGMTRAMALIGSAGVPMVMADTTTVTLPILATAAIDEGTGDLVGPPLQPIVVQRTSTRSEVTDIRFGHYGVEELEGIFGPEPPSLEGTPDSPTPSRSGEGGEERPPCDCSCQAMHELEDLDESDPGALHKAMCAQQCMPQWLQQCILGSGRGEP